MLNLLNALNKLQGKKYYGGMYYRAEGKKVVICLEETIFDYDFQPEELINLLNNYCFEWYTSTEVEVYFN